MEYLVAHSGMNPKGQRVEYRQYLTAGHSMAERRAAVYISGKCAVRGWNSDGTTYAAYQAALRGE